MPFISSRAGRPLTTKCQWLDSSRSRLRLNREGSYYSGPQTDPLRDGQFADDDFIRSYTLSTVSRRPLGILETGDGQKSSLDRPVSSSCGPELDPSPTPKLAGLSNEGSRSESRLEITHRNTCSLIRHTIHRRSVRTIALRPCLQEFPIVEQASKPQVYQRESEMAR
jgi:hypothetical protein